MECSGNLTAFARKKGQCFHSCSKNVKGHSEVLIMQCLSVGHVTLQGNKRSVFTIKYSHDIFMYLKENYCKFTVIRANFIGS